MAYVIVSSPGTECGPCTEPCKHRDCGASRVMANSACTLCGQQNGYDRKLTKYQGSNVHFACALKDADRAHGGES